MKWNRTEFLYHPQLLQVQIINKETEDEPSKTKRSDDTEDTRIGEMNKDHFKVFCFLKLQEVTKSWNDQRRHHPSRNTEEKQSSAQAYSEKSRTDLKPEVCAYSTALTKHTSQRCS